MTTYQEFAAETSSRKVALVHLDAKREVKVWTNLVSTVYSRVEDQFVIGVQIDGVIFTLGSIVTGLNSNEFFYDAETKTLFINSATDPTTQEAIITYRFFFADYDLAASFNLELGGVHVPYLGLIKRLPGFNTSLNFATGNKTLTGSGNLQLDNSTGFFNELLNTYRFENKDFAAYSWSPDIPITSHKLIYRGTTNRASVRRDSISFGIRDLIFSLNNAISATKFVEGEVIERNLNRFKKQVYGRVEGMGIQSISQLGTGYPLTGTIIAISGSDVANGTGTTFLTDLAPGDTLIAVNGIEFMVKKIVDDLTLILSDVAEATLAGSVTVRPSEVWYRSNRTFSVSQHPLKEFSTTIAGFVDNRRLRVASSAGFTAGDVVLILNERYSIDTITQIYIGANNTLPEDVIILNRTLSANNFPVVGNTITTVPITTVRNNNDDLLNDASITISNTNGAETSITLANDAEQLVAPNSFLESDITSVPNTNYFVAGIPAIQTFGLSFSGTPDFRGIFIRLIDKDDINTQSGRFVWLGNGNPTQLFTSAEVTLTSFEVGDLYQVSDGESSGDFFGVQTAGVSGVHQNLTSDEPIIVSLNNTTAVDFTLASRAVKTAIDLTNSEQLFSFNSNIWTLITNDGVTGFQNEISINAVTNITSVGAFTPGLTTGLEVSFSQTLNPRDLVRVFGANDFSQVVEAQSTYIQVSNTLGLLRTGTGVIRTPNYITDTSLVTCSAFGRTLEDTIEGTFIKTPADACRKVLVDNGLSSLLETNTFTAGSANENTTVGIYAPYNLNTTPPTILDFINKASISGLGSIGLNTNFLIRYQLLNGASGTDFSTFRIIDNNETISEARENITPSPLFKYAARNVDLSFNFGENDPNSTLLRLENARIGRLTDLRTTEDIDGYLGSVSEANNLADRYLNYASRFNRVVSFTGPLSLDDISIGDIVLLDLAELRNEAGSNLPFLGMVTSFSRNSRDITIEVDDFGGLFINASKLSNDSIGAFSTLIERQQILNGFLTNDQGLIGTDETTLGSNILV